MSQSIMRCVERISFSCSCDSVQVPEPHVSVGVMIMLNKRSLCSKRHDIDVNSCLYLANDVHAALIRLFISVVSCCSNVMVCLRHCASSLVGKTSTLMSSIFASVGRLDLWLLTICVLSDWTFFLVLLLKSVIARRRQISSWIGNQFGDRPN